MKDFNYSELVELINKIKITKQGSSVITHFGDRIVSTKSVSDKYEVFDFRPFVLSCLDAILDSYEIEKYSLSIVGGRQEIRLHSFPEIIDGETFTRSFYLLNSSDKSRALSFNYGLKHNNFQYISDKGSIYKKHYNGITKYVEDRIDLDDTIFQEQLELMRLIIGDTILMSNVQKLITGCEEIKKSKVTLFNNFNKFKNLLYTATENDTHLSKDNRSKLKVSYVNPTTPFDFTNPSNDFMVDSFLVFKTYLSMFNRRDASFIRRESKRISDMSVMTSRNNLLDELLSEF